MILRIIGVSGIIGVRTQLKHNEPTFSSVLPRRSRIWRHSTDTGAGGERVTVAQELGNAQRLKMLCLLVEAEMTVGQINAHLPELSQSALSQHLARLRDQGLMRPRARRRPSGMRGSKGHPSASCWPCTTVIAGSDSDLPPVRCCVTPISVLTLQREAPWKATRNRFTRPQPIDA